MSIPSGSPVFMEDFVLVRKRPLSLQDEKRDKKEGGRKGEGRERDQPQL